MRKKIGLFLAIISLLSFLAGCALFTKDEARDFRQMVAYIKPITYTYKTADNQTVSYERSVRILKQELVEAINKYGSDYIQNNNPQSMEDVVNYFIEFLIQRNLYLLEAEFLLKQGEIEFLDGTDGKAYNDINEINEYIYNSIDSSLFTLTNEIIVERGGTAHSEVTFDPAPEPSFPLVPSEDDEDDIILQLDAWQPSGTKAPALDDFNKQEAVRRLYNNIYDNLMDNPKALKEYHNAKKDKNLPDQPRGLLYTTEDFEEEKQAFDEIAHTPQGTRDIYFALGQSKMLQFLIAQEKREEIMIRKLQDYLTKNIRITDSDIQAEYDAQLQQQVNDFTRDYANYVSKITSDSNNVLYHPDGQYFFVKHILIPFSTEQTARLNAYKADGNRTPQEIAQFRQQLASQIQGYRINFGEQLLDRPLTVNQIYNEILSNMNTYKGNAYLSDQMFTTLAYRYNTDKGMYSYYRGYAVGPKPENPSDEQFMIEFATAARELRAQYDKDRIIGTVSEPILTDYGYHILYLSDVPSTGTNRLFDFVTAGKNKTYYDLIEESLRSTFEGQALNKFHEERIDNYLNRNRNLVEYFEKAYKDLNEMGS